MDGRLGECGGAASLCSVYKLLCIDAVDYNGVQWITLGYNGVQWSTVGYSGVQWSTVGYSGVHWGTLGYIGVQWGTLGYIGVQWGTLPNIKITWGMKWPVKEPISNTDLVCLHRWLFIQVSTCTELKVMLLVPFMVLISIVKLNHVVIEIHIGCN